MITRTNLKDLWLEIVPQAGQNIGRRADNEHPLDFFITYDEQKSMQLMLQSEYDVQLPSSSKQIAIRNNRRATDGKNAFCFSLQDNRLTEQFISLCWDIMDCTSSIEDKKQAKKAAITRLIMWQKLFAEEKSRKMSETEVKGLLGELIVLRDICLKKYDLDIAVSGWVGPIGTDRDFEYEDVCYEAKYVSLSADVVKISSLDQLDTDKRGKLVLCRFEKSSETNPDALTLSQLVESIRNLVVGDEKARVSFDNRLSLSRYNGNDELSRVPFVFYHFDIFAVDGKEFPRLRRSETRVEIAEGEYRLSIPALAQWKE